MDVDRVPAADDPAPSPTGPGPLTAAEALSAADAATRMAVRRHPVVAAATLSDFVMRAIEIAAAVNQGRDGNLDRPFIRTLAGDLSRDLGRARLYARLRYLKLDITVARDASERELALAVVRYFQGALQLAGELSHAIGGILAYHLDLRLSFSRDEDLELARQLADLLDGELKRAQALGRDLNELYRTEPYLTRNLAGQARAQSLDIGRSIGRALDPALLRSRALDRICAQGVADRLGISPTDGLAEALLDGAMDDFTSADLTHASLADADLTGVRWSPSGTTWPPGTDIKALLARSEKAGPGGDVLVVKRQGMTWPAMRLAGRLKPANQPCALEPAMSAASRRGRGKRESARPPRRS